MLDLEIEDQETPLEFQVFALAMREPGAITTFADSLPSEMVGKIHGYTGINDFYEAFLHFYDKTGLDPIDPIAWRAWLESETSIYDALGGPAPVQAFVDTCMSLPLSQPESVIAVLRHRANTRKQLDNLQALKEIVAKKGSKSDEDLDTITRLTDEIRILESNLQYNPLDSVSTADDIAARAEDLMDIPSFLPTQFKAYNRALGYTDEGGYFRGACHAIVAPSSKGKSTFAKNLCNHWADQGHTILFVNFEEAKDHWERILMSQILEENVYAKASLWTPDERVEKLDTFKTKLSEWGERFMVRHDPDTSFFEDLELWLRDIIGHNENVPDVVVIDTIQSLFMKGSGGVRWAEYEKMMVRLERLAKDMNAVFIMTAQQNLNATREKRDVMDNSDVGGSVSIIQKCSVVTIITPQKLVSGNASDDDNIMQLQITKNRITGSRFELDPPMVQYVDDSKSFIEYEMIQDEGQYDSDILDIADNIFGDNFND